MRFDVTIMPDDLNAAAGIARAVEAYGFSALWTAEVAHNAFLPLTHAAAATRRIELGTAIALAFPRSPMVTAQLAWDLAAQSKGRFLLGLGTQVEAHITRRYSIEWLPPVPRLREYIEALRAIWANWQDKKPLRFAGQYYKFTLMTPLFSPGPIEHPDIPIYIAGVNEKLCQLAGELCQGFHVHPFHTPRYLREVTLPNIEIGARGAERRREDVALTCAVFVVTGRTEAERREHAAEVKQQIAIYASTPSYRVVMELHGWGEVADRLHQMSREGRWKEMGSLISDDILREIAVIAPPEDLAYAVKARYDGLLDRVGYYFPFEPDDLDKASLWRSAADVFGQPTSPRKDA
mgnify:CR=1 FL=1